MSYYIFYLFTLTDYQNMILSEPGEGLIIYLTSMPSQLAREQEDLYLIIHKYYRGAALEIKKAILVTRLVICISNWNLLPHKMSELRKVIGSGSELTLPVGDIFL